MGEDHRSAAEHYDEEYFDQQSKWGEIGAKLQRLMFEDYVHPEEVVLDFGCGGGFLLKELSVANPLGVEINPVARAFAEKIRYSGIRGLDVQFLSVLWSRLEQYDARLIRFALNGIITAVFYLSVAQFVMYLFSVRPFSVKPFSVKPFSVRPSMAGFFAFFAALPVNYFIHKRWSFQSNRRHMHAVPAFLVIIVTGCGLNVVVIMAMFDVMGLPSVAAQLFGIATVATWNYIGFGIWAFRSSHKNAEHGKGK